jgi:hypothetical protein
VDAASFMPTIVTVPPLTATVTSSPGTLPSTFPPDSAARSTITEPARMPASITLVMSRGAGRPGIAAVVMMMSDSATCGASRSCWRWARSAASSLA